MFGGLYVRSGMSGWGASELGAINEGFLGNRHYFAGHWEIVGVISLRVCRYVRAYG
jgi:hypothetical protein